LVIRSGDSVSADEVQNGVDDFGAVATERVSSGTCDWSVAMAAVCVAEFFDEMAKDLVFGTEHRVGEEGGVSQPGEVDENGAGQLADSDGFGAEHFGVGGTAAAMLADAASELVLEEFEGWGVSQHGGPSYVGRSIVTIEWRDQTIGELPPT
jgi:hypothetical protein